MPVAYFDCFSGVAGDMVLGALVDAGMPVALLRRELKRLKIDGFQLRGRRARSAGIVGTNLHVEISNRKGFGNYRELKRVIGRSRLSKEVKGLSLKILSKLAVAEAKVHKRRIADVHFHEVGHLDSIIDVVGTAIGVEWFGFEKIYSSPLPLTRGFVKCAHGRLPVPAPATLELLKGVPVESISVKGEVVTPTGAAIMTTLADGFGSNPLRKIEKVGYGFGDRQIPGIPNGLRLQIGEGRPLVVLETNIDDMSPEFWPDVIEKVIGAGAIDAGLIPMVMKRGRPGVLLQVLCEEGDRKRIIGVIVENTTTFGVRYFPVDRVITDRETKEVRTKWGIVGVKVARFNGKTTTISPEYADCKKLALKKNIPIKEVYRQAILASGVVT